MTGKKNSAQASFPEDGGEAGSLIRSIDWSGNALGPVETWPANLRVTLNIILNSKFPMLLFWGTDFIFFYNDAFIPSLAAAGKHPVAMGKRGEKVWPEKWESIKPQIEHVLQEGKAARNEDDLIPVHSHNSDEQMYWAFNYSPVKDEAGDIIGILMICEEKRSATAAEQELKEAYEEKSHILESITDGFYMLNEDWVITHWNQEAENLLGLKRDEAIGENLWDLFPQAEELKFYSEYRNVMKNGKPSSFEEYYEPWGKWFQVNVYPSREGISVYFQDITERRRLQLINERTEEISGVGGWELDVSSNRVFMTSQAYEIYGLPKNKPVDLETNTRLFDEHSLEKIEDAVTRAIELQEPYEIELNLKRMDGENRLMRVNGFPLVENGKVTKLYGTMEDITQEKREQEELESANKKLKTAQKIAKLGYWTHDIAENVSEWSEEMYNIWERDPESFSPNFERMLETVHPEDREIFQVDAGTVFPDQQYYDSEHRIITPKGEIKWILERITLHRDEDGAPQWMEGIAQDITDLKRANEQIRLSEERYDMVAKATQDAVYDWDIIEDNLHWDEGFKSLFAHELKGDKYTIETWANNVHPEDIERARKSMEEALESPATSEWKGEYRFKKADGSYADVLERGFIIRNEEKEAVRMIGALQDITKLKQKEQELRESLKEKETLLAEIHHRVKNNLAVVSGMMQLQAYEEESEVLKEKLLDSVVRIASMASIHEQLYRSGSFSNLDFSENMKKLVDEIIHTMQAKTEIELEFSLEHLRLNVNQAIPCSLIINEVLTNILKHAFKGRKQGEITFELSENDGLVLLSIKDNGIGLPEDFESGRNSTLGLRLIDILAQQLEADYQYDSSDEGTVFSIRFEKTEMQGIGSGRLL